MYNDMYEELNKLKNVNDKTRKLSPKKIEN